MMPMPYNENHLVLRTMPVTGLFPNTMRSF
jgi:hypothetical protein